MTMDPLQNKKVSEILKFRREQKRLSLHVIHQESKISIAYLEALESGRWDLFPAEVYLTGFLRKYANYLGLNPEEMVQLYKKEMDAVKSEDEEKRKHKIEIEKQLETKSLVKGFVLLCVVILFGIWWFYTAIRSSSTKDERKIESKEMSKKYFRSSFVQGERLLLNIQPIANVWVRIVSDKTLSFEGFLSSGTIRSWEADHEFTVRLGNVNLVRISLNGSLIDVIKGSQKSVNELHLTHQSVLDQSVSSSSVNQTHIFPGDTTSKNISPEKKLNN